MVIYPAFVEDLKEGEEPLCVRFVNTVGWRGREVPAETLEHPSAFSGWLARRHLVPGPITISQEELSDALGLREAIYRSMVAVADGRRPDPADLDQINNATMGALSHLRMNLSLHWEIAGASPLDRALMLIALSAAGLLTGPDARRVRYCADPDCGWIFVDRSKNHSRRWCSMSDCGNKAKARRFRQAGLHSRQR